MRKLQCTGNNSRGRALPGIMGMSRTFWLARAMTLLVIAGVKGKAQTSKPSSVSVSSTPRQGTSSPDLSPLCSCPSCLCSHFTSLELLPCRPVFYKLNMLFLTLLTSCKCSVFHLPLHPARLSLSTLTLRSQTWSVTPFLSIISEISLLIHPRISFAFLCLTSQSGCSHSDHRVLDHLLLIISYIIPQTITNPHIPDLSSPTFCLHSHFNYSDSQGHLVLSAFYSHSSLRCQNFQFCVLGDFSLRILLALPRSSTRKDQFPTCSVRKSFGKFSPEN